MSSVSIKEFHDRFSTKTSIKGEINLGEDFTLSTIDNLGFDKNLDRVSNLLNPLSGPFLIKNAVRGDVLEVLIKNINFDRDIGISSSGILPEYVGSADVKSVLGEQVCFWQINESFCTPYINEVKATNTVNVRKSIGCLRCADPKHLSSLDYDESGGNIDFIGMTEGAKVYLPVNYHEALLYIGDVHAAQSEGELGGSGIETSASLNLNVKVAQRHYTDKIHIISGNKITFFGFGETIEDAIRDGNSQALNSSKDNSYEKTLTRLIMAQSINIKLVKLQKPIVVAIELNLDLFK